MERFTQVKVIAVSNDVEKALQELNQALHDMEFVGNQIKNVEPLFDNPRLWLVTYQKDNRGTENARGDVEQTAK